MEIQKQSTKQYVLKEALNLFAMNGYEAVSVAQIAEAVGIKAPSLYKHYKSKKDILDAILKEMQNRYEKQVASMQMNGLEPQEDVSLFMNLSEEELVTKGINLFLYFLHDEYVCAFRRMLTIEQYHSANLADLYIRQYIDDPLSFQGVMFGMFVQAGFMIPEDPAIMALHFYAPIFLLLTVCDSHAEREPEAIEMVKNHIIQFNKLYQRKGE